MYRIIFCLLTLGAASAEAALLITPSDALKHTFGKATTVSKKNTLLRNAQAAAVSKQAQLKLETKIYRIYTAKKSDKTVGYGMLITRQVRQKDASVLYIITPDGTLRAVEVIAFGEPPEYIPSETYLQQFNAKSSADTLRVGKDIPTISGATLSARNITDGSRLALALFDVLLGSKP